MIPETAIGLIKEFEGLRLDVYFCPANVLTIGYGSTRINGRPVRQTDKLASIQDAEYLLINQLKTEFIPALEKIPRWQKMTEYQQAALISFAFNLGANFYGSAGFGSITLALKEDWEAVPQALKLYNKHSGKTSSGLVRRRQAEAELWQQGLAIIENEGTTMDAQSLHKLPAGRLAEVQAQLQKLGYYPGPVDGLFGKNTGQGFAEWKADNFLAEPTLIGHASWQLLKSQGDKIIAVDWNDFDCKISKYFTVGEATNRDKRRIPDRLEIQQNILTLASKLDDIRDAWGSAIAVTSWYRPPAVNRAVGGASRSQHLTGRAVDICPVEGSIYDFQKWLDARWRMALGYGAKKGFVHIDMRAGKIRWNY